MRCRPQGTVPRAGPGHGKRACARRPWLKGQPDAKLRAYGLDRAELDDRQFTPRLLLGEYFRDQLLSLLDRHRARTEVLEATEVTDVIARGGSRVRPVRPCDPGHRTCVSRRG
ncbi:FAD/NAD(P)-binding protein [Cereibacter sphaeroides]|uniref:FAD/NAD(P)-binding protein n=1 Tax=Cereibacter sphaeroides TaxID=1063 RepID=UPI001F419EFF|nr:FAD/NAD(P)-binding protein [Cereibacter sphaeroides]